MNDNTDLELLAALGLAPEVKKAPARSPREARLITGFEEIQAFVQAQGRLPELKEDGDIFERLYAVRLNALRASEEAKNVLQDLDTEGYLSNEAQKKSLMTTIHSTTTPYSPS